MAGLEHSPIFSLMGCLLMGAAVGTLAWSAQGDFSRWLGYLESDPEPAAGFLWRSHLADRLADRWKRRSPRLP